MRLLLQWWQNPAYINGNFVSPISISFDEHLGQDDGGNGTDVWLIFKSWFIKKTGRYNSIGLDSLTNCKNKRNIVQLFYHWILLKVFGGAEKNIYTDLILKYTNLVPSDKSGETSTNNNNTLIVI